MVESRQTEKYYQEYAQITSNHYIPKECQKQKVAPGTEETFHFKKRKAGGGGGGEGGRE